MRRCAPLAEGWRDRVELYQLAPLLVHALLFGGSYVRARPSAWPRASAAPAPEALALAGACRAASRARGRRRREGCTRAPSSSAAGCTCWRAWWWPRHYRRELTLAGVARALCQLAAPAAARIRAVRRADLPRGPAPRGGWRLRRSCWSSSARSPCATWRGSSATARRRTSRAPSAAATGSPRRAFARARFRRASARRARRRPRPPPRRRPSGSAARGRRRRISVPPPGAGSAVTPPPCWSATWRTIARPRPEPGRPRASAPR